MVEVTFTPTAEIKEEKIVKEKILNDKIHLRGKYSFGKKNKLCVNKWQPLILMFLNVILDLIWGCVNFYVT